MPVLELHIHIRTYTDLNAITQLLRQQYLSKNDYFMFIVNCLMCICLLICQPTNQR